MSGVDETVASAVSGASLVDEHGGQRGVGDDEARLASGTAAKPSSRSILPPHGAFVPFPEQEMGDQAGRKEDQDAGEGEEHQGREEARDVQPVLRLDQAEGEAGAGAGRAGGELGDDGGDQGEAAGDPEAGEEIGEGVRQLQVDERLPAAGAVELEQVEEIVVGRCAGPAWCWTGPGRRRRSRRRSGSRSASSARRSGSAARWRRSASPAG